jgi:hypothetical protein
MRFEWTTREYDAALDKRAYLNLLHSMYAAGWHLVYEDSKPKQIFHVYRREIVEVI